VDYLATSPLGAWVQGEAQLLRATRSMVFMQGLVSADGQPVARTSGVFKIGPRFEDAAMTPPPKP
jgi:acyl-coenzyme A thioesterase PaaI-like protein